MKTLFLKIYGINIKISANSDYAFENLEKDFTLYIDEKQDFYLGRGITVNILKESAPYWMVPPVEAGLYSLGYICYKNKGTHYVDYGGKGLMIYNFKEEKADIYSEDENLLYEKARLAILSRVGEILDNRHIHRLHATGFVKNNKASICILPMEAGKTTLTLGVLKKDMKINIISEDICLIDFKNYIYPFMLRIGARDKNFITEIPENLITKIDRNFYGEKYLIDLSYFEDRISRKARLHNVLIGKRVFQKHTEIREISKLSCFGPFIQSGIFGLGLPLK